VIVDIALDLAMWGRWWATRSSVRPGMFRWGGLSVAIAFCDRPSESPDFVQRLVRCGLIVRDPVVRDVLRGRPADVTARTVRRHFLSATGLTPGLVRQIERAREATMLASGQLSVLYKT
jgi:hypothetical protein